MDFVTLFNVPSMDISNPKPRQSLVHLSAGKVVMLGIRCAKKPSPIQPRRKIATPTVISNISCHWERRHSVRSIGENRGQK